MTMLFNKKWMRLLSKSNIITCFLITIWTKMGKLQSVKLQIQLDNLS